MSTLIYGIGINDYDGNVSYKNDKGIKTNIPTYAKWQRMVESVYSKKELKRKPSYNDVTICEEWITFSNFHNWMLKYPYPTEGKELDKDILVPGSRLYSPDTCVFVPKSINNAMYLREYRGKCVRGVRETEYGRFRARGSAYGKTYELGSYSSVEQAEQAYKSFRAKYYMDLADGQEDHLVSMGLYKHAEILEYGNILL